MNRLSALAPERLSRIQLTAEPGSPFHRNPTKTGDLSDSCAEPIFADNTAAPGFGLDADAVRAAVTPRTKAVLSVPLWGCPTPMDDLVSVCRDKGVMLLEDVAQSHGTKWKGKFLGTFGVAGCASTHERKLIATGEGGLVLTDDETLATKVATIARYGATAKGAGYELGCNFKLRWPVCDVGDDPDPEAGREDPPPFSLRGRDRRRPSRD